MMTISSGVVEKLLAENVPPTKAELLFLDHEMTMARMRDKEQEQNFLASS